MMLVRGNVNSTRDYRVLLADDHPVVRQGLRKLLETQPGIEICAEASTGSQAVDQAKKVKPDLVVLDLTMPGKNGLEAAREIHDAFPETAILIFSMHYSEEIAREALRLGARGYILKSDAGTELISAIQRLREGKPFFTSCLNKSITEAFVNGKNVEESPLAGVPLSRRELEIVRLLSEGKSNKEVAGFLAVSTRTVESDRSRIMHKMKFSNFGDLVRFAIRNNLVER